MGNRQDLKCGTWKPMKKMKQRNIPIITWRVYLNTLSWQMLRLMTTSQKETLEHQLHKDYTLTRLKKS